MNEFMDSPLVSVIMATYNWSTVLPYSIGSVLAQTFRNFELLVVGDGCTDDSESVVRAIGDPRVQWINLPSNSGHQSAPNNEGLRRARGKYIAYLGHDDLWLPHHLSGLVQVFSVNVDFAYSMMALVFPEGGVELRPFRFEYHPGMAIAPSSVMHQRNVIDLVGEWKDYRTVRLHPENDLWERIYEIRHSVEFVSRLSVIKFPAGLRKNAYKSRLSAEQAAWFERIQKEPDLESVELGKLIARENRMLGSIRDKPYRYVLGEFWSETISRTKRRLSGNKKTIEQIRRYKGLESNEQE